MSMNSIGITINICILFSSSIREDRRFLKHSVKHAVEKRYIDTEIVVQK